MVRPTGFLHVQQLLRQSLDRQINRLRPDERGWSDAVAAAPRRLPHEHRINYESPDSGSLVHHIDRRLGHLVVNPSDRSRTVALNESYVTLMDCDLEASEQTVNSCEETAEALVETLIRSARTQQELIVDPLKYDVTERSLAARKAFILHGERGCGKTFFLNFLLSKFSPKLDDRKVIWVRLNLVEDFRTHAPPGSDPAAYTTDLDHWIYAQATKIILRYYDPRSRSYPGDFGPKEVPLSLYDDLNRYVQEEALDEPQRRSLMDALLGMKQVFYDRKQDEPLTPAAVPKVMGRHVFNLAIEAGYGFIVVLDGLDQLEETTAAERKFSALLAEVKRLLAAQESRMALVIVCRTATTNQLWSEADPYSFEHGEVFTVGSVPLREVLKKRIDFLRDEARSEELQDAVSTFGESVDDHLNAFWEYLSRPEHDSEYLDEVARIFGDNLRAQMQTIQFTYFDFLRRSDEHSYRLTECLMLCGKPYPPNHYRYVLNQNGELERLIGESSRFDSRLLPSVFNFPHLDEPSDRLPSLEGVLIGVRMLQFVLSNHTAREEGAPIDRLSGDDLATLCEQLFDYPKDVVLALLEEYNSYEIFRLRGTDSPMAPTLSGYEVGPMPKAFFIYERCLTDIAYLNLASLRVPLSTRAFDSTRFLHAYAFDSGVESLRSWVFSKISNSAAIFRLIKHVNDVQQVRYFERISQVPAHLEATNRVARSVLFSFIEPVRHAIEDQCEKMLSAAESDRKLDTDALETRLANYRRAWGQ